MTDYRPGEHAGPQMSLPEALRAALPDPLPLSQTATAAARDRLVRAAGEAPAERRLVRSRGQWWRPRRRLAWSTGLALAVVVVALLVVVRLPGAVPPAQAQARAALNAAGTAAARTTAVPARADQVLYVRTDQAVETDQPDALTDPGASRHAVPGLTWVLRDVDERWTPVDGRETGLDRSTAGHVRFLRPGDAARYRKAGLVDPAGRVDQRAVPPVEQGTDDLENPSYGYLQTLTTDPDRLYDLVLATSGGSGPSLPYEMLTVVGSLLASGGPPALASAAYRVAARVPGVGLVGQTTDLLGRPATAVGADAPDGRIELLFDPSTGRFLGKREVVAGMTWESARTVAVVDRVRQVP